MSTHEGRMRRFARGGVRPEQRVSLEEAERRALDSLDRDRGTRPSVVADAIWPGHTMKPQGAALAAGKILGRLLQRGLAGYAGKGAGWVRKG